MSDERAFYNPLTLSTSSGDNRGLKRRRWISRNLGANIGNVFKAFFSLSSRHDITAELLPGVQYCTLVSLATIFRYEFPTTGSSSRFQHRSLSRFRTGLAICPIYRANKFYELRRGATDSFNVQRPVNDSICHQFLIPSYNRSQLLQLYYIAAKFNSKARLTKIPGTSNNYCSGIS